MNTLFEWRLIIFFLLAVVFVALGCELTPGPTEQESEQGTSTPEPTSPPPANPPITHFIAVGDRPVGVDVFFNPFFHYSLEYWDCGGDYKPLNHTDGYTPAQIVANCKAISSNPSYQPRKLGGIELLAVTDWTVWGGVDDFFGSGRSWVEQGVSIGEIMYTGTRATSIMPIYTGTAAAVQTKWNAITGIARGYRWGEQSGFAVVPAFTQWPRSMYMPLQTNSNTFVIHLVTTSGLTMTDMDGLQPGNDTPKQNGDTHLGRAVTLYSAHTPWGPGSPAKPKPGGTPP